MTKMLRLRPRPRLRPLLRATLLMLGLALLPTSASAQADCAKSPTFMRKIAGGQEIVFHPECEPPALTPKPGKKTPKMAPVSATAPAPVAVAGAGTTTVAHVPAAAAANAAAAPAANTSRKANQSEQVRIQAYTRTRRR